MRRAAVTDPSGAGPFGPHLSAAALAPLSPHALMNPYRDPVWDGPKDPVVVADYRTGEWVLFYTQRRASEAGLTGVEWVHGTAIGVARSSDGGLNWAYQGTLEGLEGLVIPGRPHEGPKVFRLEGSFWMIVDEWRGQGVYRSDDAAGGWVRQEYLDGLILTAPETYNDGPVVGRHADVVPLERSADGKERALLVYFTHPYWNGEDIGGMTTDPKTHLSHVRATVLEVHDCNLVCTHG